MSPLLERTRGGPPPEAGNICTAWLCGRNKGARSGWPIMSVIRRKDQNNKETQVAKQQQKRIISSAGAAAARAVEPVAKRSRTIDPVAETAARASVPEREQIAVLAYSYWQARGCSDGSPEQDWLRAEAELGTPPPGRSG